MVGAFFASLALMLVVLLIPGLQGIFEITGMTGVQWGVVVGLSLAPLVIVEITKGIQALIWHLKKKNNE